MEGEKRNVVRLRDETYRQLYECRFKEIMSDNNHDLLRSFEKYVQKAYNEVCGYKKNRKCSEGTWWWNSGVKNEIQRKEEAHKAMTRNPTEEAKNEYRR